MTVKRCDLCDQAPVIPVSQQKVNVYHNGKHRNLTVCIVLSDETPNGEVQELGDVCAICFKAQIAVALDKLGFQEKPPTVL